MNSEVASTESTSIDESQALVQSTVQVAMEHDAAFLATWLHGKSEKTRRAYESDIRKFYASVGKSLAQVQLADVQAFIDSLASLKVSSQTRAVAALKSCLSFAVKTGYLQLNVGAAVKLPKGEDRLAERIMSEQAVAKMLAKEENPRNHAILVLLYRAGLRAQEVCTLQWRHVQPREHTGQLAIYGKGKKTRFILLDQGTWDELQALRPHTASPDTYVFQSRQQRTRTGETGRQLDPSMIFRIVRAAAKRAGISGNVSPHWMRHAHATHSLENGAPITLVKETLGHSSMETTARYTHVRPNASSGQYLKV
jgi:site-specific recombinase XerD